MRRPNLHLGALLVDAGISHKGLAARVREEAVRDGHRSSADHTAVARWLAGVTPRAGTQVHIVRVLSAKLGRRVSLTEAGFSQANAGAVVEEGPVYPVHAADAVRLLSGLAGADLEDRPEVMRTTWSPDAASRTISDYLFGTSPPLSDLSLSHHGATAADAIRATAAHLMNLDFEFGGGHVRKLLLFYFQSEISPLLKSDQRVHRDVYAASAEVAQLLGWSAYDSGSHGVAQRYFVQGLRLAREADDARLGARLLGNLSHQANFRGRADQALQLARAAKAAIAGKATPAVEANILAMEARALATMGDTRSCVSTLRQAEHALDRCTSGSDPEWISYFDAGELAGESAHCFRDLGLADDVSGAVSLALVPDLTPARTRAFIGMVSAASVLQAGDLEEASDLALTAVRAAGPLKSRRYIRYLMDFHGALVERYPREPAVITYLNEVRTYYPDFAQDNAAS